jgi:NFACT protein RNA binding domain
MVFYFSTNAHKQGEDAWLIYMGKDKYENEDLIKHGWPVDVWCSPASRPFMIHHWTLHQASNDTFIHVTVCKESEVLD